MEFHHDLKSANRSSKMLQKVLAKDFSWHFDSQFRSEIYITPSSQSLLISLTRTGKTQKLPFNNRVAWNPKKEAIAFPRLGCRTGIGETVGVATFGAAEKPGETSSCPKRVEGLLYTILFIVTYRGVFLQSADVDVPSKHMAGKLLYSTTMTYMWSAR